jgi:hypothetical protein
MRASPSVLLVAVALAGAAACGPGSKTPAEAYARFSAAVTAGDGAALFDALDSRSRWAYMSVQKFHREAYDIVLSNYPQGPVREREQRRFETAATATSARELFHREIAAGLWEKLRPLVEAGARVEVAPSGDQASAVLASGARVALARGRGGWGFAGLDEHAEDLKNRAFHDLEVVRASAADYERAAARAAK